MSNFKIRNTLVLWKNALSCHSRENGNPVPVGENPEFLLEFTPLQNGAGITAQDKMI